MSTTLAKPEMPQAAFREIPIHKLIPSPENDQLYRPIELTDPDIIELADSIAEIGVQEPLVVTADYFVVSGHRRLAAAKQARLSSVPCRVLDFDKDDDIDQFMQLLRECNRQRVKTFGEALREQAIDADPEVAYQALVEHRREASAISVDNLIDIREGMKRSIISPAKKPLLDAIQKILVDMEDFLPISVRQIHYNLLNDPPLKHASKPDSVYCNDAKGTSYDGLVKLLVRARIEGIIPYEAIADETRPVVIWNTHDNAPEFMKRQMDGFGRGYWRDLVQSQPNHIEIVGEKNTINGTIRSVAAEFCIPMTIGRGICSLPPRCGIVNRFRKSGKEKLILLVISDFDPPGEVIAGSLARSIYDDFDVSEIEPIKVALNASQASELKLPPGGKAKKQSAGYSDFVNKYGDDVWELEALPPVTLQEILRDAIDSVIDVDAFNYEVDCEKEDAAKLENARGVVVDALEQYQDQQKRLA